VVEQAIEAWMAQLYLYSVPLAHVTDEMTYVGWLQFSSRVLLSVSHPREISWLPPVGGLGLSV